MRSIASPAMESCVLIFLCCGFALATDSVNFQNAWYTQIPRDDAQRCPQKLNTLEVLPGTGFDNLNNKEMGRVLAVNFSSCSVTLDGKYVIPDFVEVVPRRTSIVHLYSKLIDKWQNYSSTTSRSINIDASASFVFGSISGSFSDEHESVRKKMAEDKSVTVKTELRHTFYRVQAQPDAQLHDRCKARLLDIASYRQRNDTYMAVYLSQLFVRDFGTHVTTASDAGAVIAQTSQLNRNFVETFNEDKSKITAAASGSFLGIFSAGGSYSTSTDTKTMTSYLKNVRDSHVSTIGGPPYRANYTLNQWEDGLHDRLVVVDRSGDPIWYAITPNALPELPADTIQDLADLIKEAVRQYYLHNVHRGCTNSDSKNYDPMANFDGDSSLCEPATTNYTFGGVFQTCNGPEDFCSKNRQVNPKTRDYRCPNPYKAQLLYSFNGPRECTKHCSGWWIFESCDWSCSVGVVHAYWCYATDHVPPQHGYLFGGVYTDNTVNMITQEKKCPSMFYPLKIVEGYVCVSDDYELGYRFSYPFGGFISCEYGNPLADAGTKSKLNANPNSLKNFFAANKKGGGSPKHCPKGYSQHLMQISHGCEINYCVQKNAFGDKMLPILRRPPYVERPVPISNNSMYLLTAAGRILKKEEQTKWVQVDMESEIKAMQEIKEQASQSRSPASGSGGVGLGGTVALTVFGTIMAGLVVWAVIVLVTKYKQRPFRRRMEAPQVTYTGRGSLNQSTVAGTSSDSVSVNTESSPLVA